MRSLPLRRALLQGLLCPRLGVSASLARLSFTAAFGSRSQRLLSEVLSFLDKHLGCVPILPPRATPPRTLILDLSSLPFCESFCRSLLSLEKNAPVFLSPPRSLAAEHVPPALSGLGKALPSHPPLAPLEVFFLSSLRYGGTRPNAAKNMFLATSYIVALLSPDPLPFTCSRAHWRRAEIPAHRVFQSALVYPFWVLPLPDPFAGQTKNMLRCETRDRS